MLYGRSSNDWVTCSDVVWVFHSWLKMLTETISSPSTSLSRQYSCTLLYIHLLSYFLHVLPFLPTQIIVCCSKFLVMYSWKSFSLCQVSRLQLIPVHLLLILRQETGIFIQKMTGARWEECFNKNSCFECGLLPSYFL